MDKFNIIAQNIANNPEDFKDPEYLEKFLRENFYAKEESNIYKKAIDVIDFVMFVDERNSGADRDTVFNYLETFLKQQHKINVDFDVILGHTDDDEE
jgi:hypothetical protein